MAKGQLVGYIRVSTEEQNTARQQEALADFNLDKTFTATLFWPRTGPG